MMNPALTQKFRQSLTQPLPCLLIKRRSYTHGEVMMEYVEGLFRGDTYSYRLRLGT
jgi:GntR family transcriptional regulator